MSDVLCFESIQAGKFPVHREFVPFVETVETMIKHCRSIVFEKQITLTVENLIRDDGVSCLYAFLDHFKAEQAFRNIISNSCKFTPTGGNITVTLRLLEEDVAVAPMKASAAVHPLREEMSSGSFVIDIKDNGVGMTADNLDKLFGHFVQFDANALQGTLDMKHLSCHLASSHGSLLRRRRLWSGVMDNSHHRQEPRWSDISGV